MRKLRTDPRSESSNDLPFLAKQYRRLGKLDEAIELCRQPTTQPYQYPSRQVDLGRLYLLKGMTNDAGDAFHAQFASWLERIKSGHADAEAYNYLAWAYIQERALPAEALELARKGLAMAPGDANIQDTLAWALMRNGRFEEALERFAPALTNRPVNALLEASAWRALFELAENSVPETLWTTFVTTLEESLRNEPAGLARLNLVRSRFHAHRGETQKADALRLASGYPKMRDWVVLGPFANERGTGYDYAFIPEDQPTMDSQAAYASSLGPLRWEHHPTAWTMECCSWEQSSPA